LYEHLVAYLSGKASLRDFRQWYDAATWDQHTCGNMLASDVELWLSEFSSGHRTEHELRDLLSEASARSIVPIQLFTTAMPFAVSTGAANEAQLSFSAAATTLGSFVGKLRETEYA